MSNGAITRVVPPYKRKLDALKRRLARRASRTTPPPAVACLYEALDAISAARSLLDNAYLALADGGIDPVEAEVPDPRVVGGELAAIQAQVLADSQEIATVIADHEFKVRRGFPGDGPPGGGLLRFRDLVPHIVEAETPRGAPLRGEAVGALLNARTRDRWCTIIEGGGDDPVSAVLGVGPAWRVIDTQGRVLCAVRRWEGDAAWDAVARGEGDGMGVDPVEGD